MEKESQASPETTQNLRYAVLIPYASNINTEGPHKGKIRPTFFTDFVINVGYEHYAAKAVDKLILCGEQTFGDLYPSTSQLMRERLMKMGVQEKDIITVGTTNKNTAEQIGAVASYQRVNNLQQHEFTLISLGYHKPRIRTHMKGFGLNGKVVLAEDLHKHYNPNFNKKVFQEMIGWRPLLEEFPVRILGLLDPRGEVIANRISNHIGVRTFDLYPTKNPKDSTKRKSARFVPSKQRLEEVASAA